ncbi:transposase [Methylonatrum kenyense]|uniref:transposase n=1 Tax=Methylonatrum kenyense TaxID=455253 RepID=UPI0020BEF544|nr:transposase [Methylonatrum kenyense]MCK8515196.1 transposase [Methylonatrum kenyense]
MLYGFSLGYRRQIEELEETQLREGGVPGRMTRLRLALRAALDPLRRCPCAPPNVPEYPFHERTILVTRCGQLCIGRRKISLSTVFAGQHVGIREVADRIWLVSFMQYDLGFFDEDADRVEPAENPFGPKVLPMCSV